MDASKVLVIEDERHIARFIEFVLTRAGYKVAVRHSAEGVLEVLRAEQPRVLILDLMLPGISGLDVLAELKGTPEREGLMILVLTASSVQDETKQFVEENADAYCAKPIAPTTLVGKLKQLGVNP